MTALPLTSVFLIGSRRSFRLVERNLYVYRHGWLVLLSGFFEPLFYLLSIRVGFSRLIGDVQPGAEKVTFTVSAPYNANAPLRPSGLIGPVQIIRLR